MVVVRNVWPFTVTRTGARTRPKASRASKGRATTCPPAPRASTAASNRCASGILAVLEQRAQELDRDREHDRRVVRRSDLEQRLQVAQLDGDRLAGHHRGGILEPLGRLV